MSSPDICGIDVQELYLEDPGNKQEPAGYMLCSDMGSTCTKNGCRCRNPSSGIVNGSTTHFGVCVILKNGADCATSGENYITCAVGPSSSKANARPVAKGSLMTTKAIVESANTPSVANNASLNGKNQTESVKVAQTARSTFSVNSTEIIIMIAIAVVFVAIVSWAVRSYCVRRSKTENKLSPRRNGSARTSNCNATSPTQLSGRTSATPSFPAFDRRTRSSASGGHGRGNQEAQRRGRDQNAGRGRDPNPGRDRRNPAMDFATNGARREPNSGRGRRNDNIDARGAREPGIQREPNSGRGRRDNPAGLQTERTPPREARAKPTASPKQARPIVSNKAPTGGTVYTGLNSYERVAQFAQLAAFEAPAPPPPSRPPKPIQTVAVSDAIPKRVRAPAQPPRQAAQTPRQAAPPAPKHPSFYIDENLVNEDYDILSPKTARSLAPSIASAATTVIAPGRNRPTPLQQGRRAQQSNATPSYYQSGYSRDDNKYGDENRYGNDKRDETGLKSTFKATSNYNDSFVSESSAWSAASDISDDSYYHAAPSNTARIPVIEAPRDDDDQSEDGYSDWGHSTQQNADDFRSTGASDSSFFSVNSDFSNSTSVFKEREF